MMTLQHLQCQIAFGAASHAEEHSFERWCLACMLCACLSWCNAAGGDMPSLYCPSAMRRATDSIERKREEKKKNLVREYKPHLRHKFECVSVCIVFRIFCIIFPMSFFTSFTARKFIFSLNDEAIFHLVMSAWLSTVKRMICRTNRDCVSPWVPKTWLVRCRNNKSLVHIWQIPTFDHLYWIALLLQERKNYFVPH